MRTILICFVFFFSAPAHAWFWSYKTYEDCMLDKMKGQNQGMWSTADRACKKEFKVEFPLYENSVEWSFSTIQGSLIVIRITPKDDDYVITQGVFKFGPGPCDKPIADDWLIPVEFKNGRAELNVFGEHQCGKLVSLKARYR